MDKNTLSSRYSEPVSRLLTLGNPIDVLLDNEPTLDISHNQELWPDYPKVYGLTDSDIPELIRLASDEELLDSEGDPTWGAVHAWRALGQLHAVEAIHPLVKLFSRVDEKDDDWVIDELPVVLAQIGPLSVAPVAEYLVNLEHGEGARLTAESALEQLALTYPEAREECAAALVAALENYRTNPEDLNAFLALAIADLKYTEAYPLVEKAFSEDLIDPFIMGDWEDFQVKVGLLQERITPEPNTVALPLTGHGGGYDGGRGSRKEDKKTKQKRKEAKASRKKNRKRK
jgi:hypothetical protein